MCCVPPQEAENQSRALFSEIVNQKGATHLKKAVKQDESIIKDQDRLVEEAKKLISNAREERDKYALGSRFWFWFRCCRALAPRPRVVLSAPGADGHEHRDVVVLARASPLRRSSPADMPPNAKPVELRNAAQSFVQRCPSPGVPWAVALPISGCGKQRTTSGTDNSCGVQSNACPDPRGCLWPRPSRSPSAAVPTGVGLGPARRRIRVR